MPCSSRTAETLHVRRPRGPTQHGGQRDEQDLHQVVTCVVRPRIAQRSEKLLEFAHVTPLTIRESPSESTFAAGAIPAPNPYAIPLPYGGGIGASGVEAVSPHPH